MSLHDEIKAVLDDYIAKWNVYDIPGMKALWDSDEAEPIYVAEERDPIIGWQAMETYWGGGAKTSTHLIKYSDLMARKAADDVAHAFYRLHWNVYIPGGAYPRPIGNSVRVTSLLRKKPAGWRLFHHIEAPEASIIQLRKAHERAVDPELFEMLKKKGITF
ncbi:MAG: nuclear transport factor 2 family protein [Rhodobacteraceae bacterium]|nr:nuclear transport factor 2 family protein [Paracoccaceae bacterium]